MIYIDGLQIDKTTADAKVNSYIADNLFLIRNSASNILNILGITPSHVQLNDHTNFLYSFNEDEMLAYVHNLVKHNGDNDFTEIKVKKVYYLTEYIIFYATTNIKMAQLYDKWENLQYYIVRKDGRK